VIEELVPAGVAVAESFELRLDVELFPAEQAAIAAAVPKRRGEFTTARFCCRQALARLGVPPVAVVPGARGAPGWPPGIAGSITHCGGYAACAVARTSEVLSIGIDAEPNDPLPVGVLKLVASPQEIADIARRRAAEPSVAWDRLLFSVKESVYKTWFPLTGTWLDFGEATVTIAEPVTMPSTTAADQRAGETVRCAGTFEARLLVPGPIVAGRGLVGFTGRWLARDGFLATAITLPAAD